MSADQDHVIAARVELALWGDPFKPRTHFKETETMPTITKIVITTPENLKPRHKAELDLDKAWVNDELSMTMLECFDRLTERGFEWSCVMADTTLEVELATTELADVNSFVSDTRQALRAAS